jgi:hypothetical protein
MTHSQVTMVFFIFLAGCFSGATLCGVVARHLVVPPPIKTLAIWSAGFALMIGLAWLQS